MRVGMKTNSFLRGCIAGFLLLSTLSGCGLLSDTVSLLPDVASSTASSPTVGEWISVGKGAERAEFSFATSSGAIIVLYRFQPEHYRWRFLQALPPKNLLGWKGSATGSVLMVNGVFFHEDELPSGFLKIKGEQIGKRRFDEDKSGIMVLDPTPKILKTSLDDPRVVAAQEVGQSYPFLLMDGEPRVATDTGKIARRTFIGEDRDGRIYVGIVPFASISLHNLAQVLKKLPITWQHVLNLDGGPSSGLISSFRRHSELIDSYAQVPNVISVELKEE